MRVDKTFYIGFRDVDKNLYLKSGELLNKFVDVASFQSESVGDSVYNHDYRWVLVGYNVKIFDKPKYSEDVVYTTWSRDYSTALAAREFEIRGKNGDLLTVGLANFVKYNVKAQKLEKIEGELMQAYKSEPTSNFDGQKLKKFSEPDCYDGEERIYIDWKWMDSNDHMNNSYYLDIAEHIVAQKYGYDTVKCDFDVLFKQQIRENTCVVCKYKESADGFSIALKSEDDKLLYGGVYFYKNKLV